MKILDLLFKSVLMFKMENACVVKHLFIYDKKKNDIECSLTTE